MTWLNYSEINKLRMSESDRLRGVGFLINYIDREINDIEMNDKEFVDFMLKKKVEALQLSVELMVKIIIDRHC